MSKTYEEILQGLKDAFEENAAAWGDLTGYLKTTQSKAITLQDWNTLIALLGRTDSYIRAMYPLMSGLGDLGTTFKDDVSDIRSDAELARDAAILAKNDAEAVRDEALSKTIATISVVDGGKLCFTFEDGSTVVTESSVMGPQGPQGDNIIDATELPQEWYELNEKLEEEHRIMGGLIYKGMDGVIKVTPLAPPYGVREDECGVAMNALAMYNSKQQILCKPPTDERHAVNLGYLIQELKKYISSGGGTIVGDLKVTGGDLVTDYVQISKIGHETSSSYGRVLTLSTSGYARYRTLDELASDLGAVTEDWVKNYVQNAIAAIPNAKGVGF